MTNHFIQSCNFIELKPVSNEEKGKQRNTSKQTEKVGRGGTGARSRRAGFRRDSDNLRVEQRHRRLHHVVAATRRQ